MAFSHEDYMAARRRREETNAMIARSDPGRFSSFERNALLGMQHTKGGDIAYVDRSERAGLRQHEMDMLKQRGENEFKVAEQKRFGMKEQGSDAAKFRADAEIKKAETEWGARKAIAQTEAEAKKYGADRGLSATELEWGKNGSDGTRKPGGREAVAGIEGKSRVDAAREQAKLAAEQNKQKRALEDQKRLAADERAKKREAEAEQRAFYSWTNTALDPVRGILTPAERTAFQSMSPDERRQFWIKKTGRNSGARGTEGANQGNGGNWKSALGW